MKHADIKQGNAYFLRWKFLTRSMASGRFEALGTVELLAMTCGTEFWNDYEVRRTDL